jgi:LacI family transcriptional regulator
LYAEWANVSEHDGSFNVNRGGPMSLSIKRIAELAGVSRGTVDRAINDRPGINPQIKEQILRIAAEAGYRTNRAGKMLGLRKNPLKIGIQLPSVGNEFYLDVLAGIRQAEAELADFGLILAIRTMKGYSAQTQVGQIRELLAEGIQALAFVPVDEPAVIELLDELAGIGIPVMTVNADLASARRLGYVGNNYEQSGIIAGGLLGILANGRPTNVLAVTGSSHIQGHIQRINGFCRSIAAHYPTVRIIDIEANEDDEEISYQKVLAALRRWPELNGIYLAAGGVSGACRALLEKQGKNSRKMRVICFDQIPGTLEFRRSGLITASIGQEPFQQGYLPVKYLYEFLLDGTRPPEITWTRNEIMIREHLSSQDPSIQTQIMKPLIKEDFP